MAPNDACLETLHQLVPLSNPSSDGLNAPVDQVGPIIARVLLLRLQAPGDPCWLVLLGFRVDKGSVDRYGLLGHLLLGEVVKHTPSTALSKIAAQLGIPLQHAQLFGQR